MNNAFKWILMEAVVTYSKALSWSFLGGTEGNHDTQLAQSLNPRIRNALNQVTSYLEVTAYQTVL
jgi:hypothetical protein